MEPAQPLPARAAETTAERPWPVALLSDKIHDYVERMSPVWIEGQIVQLTRRPGAAFTFLTLRDSSKPCSLNVKISARRLEETITDGNTVVAHVKPEFWKGNGSLTMHARQIRAVGVGELLARIAALGRTLAAEGLFDVDRKKPLPFLPRTVGLICGRNAKAYDDVVNNARLRWPAVQFRDIRVAVQGPQAATEVARAIAELDADREVDVIVVARGGGAVEDLLPFSDEGLVRAAARCATPLVSAIGHEADSPLLDHVADYRASTPTDAARRIVPDVAEELRGLSQARGRLRHAITTSVQRESDRLAHLTSRPVLAQPERMLEPHTAQLHALLGQLRALSPLETLERGYAVVRQAGGTVVRSPAQVSLDEELDVRVAGGRLGVRAISVPPPAQV